MEGIWIDFKFCPSLKIPFALSGPFLVSRTGDAGCSERLVKCAKFTDCLNLDPIKNIFSSRQRGDGHGS